MKQISPTDFRCLKSSYVVHQQQGGEWHEALPPVAACSTTEQKILQRQLATENPNQQVVFFGIGFEMTAPANAIRPGSVGRGRLA